MAGENLRRPMQSVDAIVRAGGALRRKEEREALAAKEGDGYARHEVLRLQTELGQQRQRHRELEERVTQIEQLLTDALDRLDQ